MRRKCIHIFLYLAYLFISTTGLFLVMDGLLYCLDRTKVLRVPTLAQNTYPKDPEAYYKVAFFGESTLQNHGVAIGFPNMLAVELKSRYPDKRFYFRNFAISGTTFHGQQAEVAKANVDRYDLLVICAGHNEVHTVLDRTGYFRKPEFKNLRQIGGRPTDDLSVLFRYLNYHSRIYAMATRIKQRRVDSMIQKAGGIRADIRFAEFRPASEGLIPPEERPKLIEQYADDLQEIFQRARKSGTKLLVMTMPSNFSWPPCFSLLDEKVTPQDRETWREEFARGMAHVKVGDHAAAIDCFQKAYRIDRGVAILGYQMGLSKRAVGKTEEAKALLRQASDSDGYLARMSTQYAPVASNKAKAFENVRFHDLAKTMEDMVDLGYDWNDLFIDVQHPSVLGHAIIAQVALEELAHFGEFARSNPGGNSDFKSLDYKSLEDLYFRSFDITNQDQANKARERLDWYISFSDLCAYPAQIFALAERDLRDLRLLLKIYGDGDRESDIMVHKLTDLLNQKKSSRRIEQRN